MLISLSEVADKVTAQLSAQMDAGGLTNESAETTQAASLVAELTSANSQLSSMLQLMGQRMQALQQNFVAMAAVLQPALQAAAQLAPLVLKGWALLEQPAARQLEAARAAATRSCAYLCCANLGGEGGPFAGQGVGSMRCR